MGKYKNTMRTKFLLWGLGGIVTVLNIALFVSFFI